MKPLEPKTTLQNRYQITDLIGKGGMGEVYLAIDQRLGHSVALKRTTVGDDVMLTEAFEREARTLASLRHNVLPKVSDHFIENDEQFLVMEYIPGEDLSERLKATEKPFPLNWVLFWADQLLDALTYLHTHDPPIIHRDIKPQNLKLTADNNIVLLDFGLSKNALGQTRVTTSGSVVGYTPHYAPMEQIRGTGTNARSDIFSLSATLYHLLSNTVPPDALTRADAMLAGMPDPLKPLTESNPEMIESISDAIMKGIEISQEKRFETAREMQKVLRRAFNDMQKSMSAETVAFNAGSAGISYADLKTEVISDVPLPPTNETADQAASEPFASNEDFSAEKTEMIDPAELQGLNNAANPDATVEFNGQIADFPNENKAAQTSADSYVTQEEEEEDIPAEIPSENEFKTSEDFSTNEDYSAEDFQTSEDVSKADDPLPDATVPLITMDTGLIEGDGDESPAETTNWDEGFESEVISADVETESPATAAFGLTDNFSADRTENYVAEEVVAESYSEENASNEEALTASAAAGSATAQPIPPKQKSSTGKYIAILGGLGAVLFLLLGTGLAVGWYYANGGFGLGGDNTTTEKTPETTPSVEQNPEVVETSGTNSEDTTANSDNSNTENAETTDETTDETSVDTPADTTATTNDTSTGGKSSTTSKTSNPTTKRSNTGTTTKPPVKKDTTKPPKKDTTTKPPTPKPVEKKKKDAGVL